MNTQQDDPAAMMMGMFCCASIVFLPILALIFGLLLGQLLGRRKDEDRPKRRRNWERKAGDFYVGDYDDV